MKTIAISCNMDSFGHSISKSPFEGDPFWRKVLDRILNVANRHAVPVTFFVIASDLKNREVSERSSDLSKSGHEIANHTLSHPQNFGKLNYANTLSEIKLAHRLIFDSTGVQPTSFLSPGWNVNPYQFEILSDLGYTNDSSFFPHFFVQAATLKMAFNKIASQLRGLKTTQYRLMDIWGRQDYTLPFIGIEKWLNLKGVSSKPRLLPMESGSPAIPPYWFTLEYISSIIAERSFSTFLTSPQRYLLIHPADFADYRDIETISTNEKHSFERMHIQHEKYLEIFEHRILTLKQLGFRFVRMRDLINE